MKKPKDTETPYKFIDSMTKEQKLAYKKKLLRRYQEMRELIEYVDSKLV